MTMYDVKIASRAADTIRVLTAEAIQKAKSGHPGPFLKDMMFSTASYVYPPSEFIHTMWQTELLSLLLAAVFWIASHIILKKHLNME
ncbi:MAG: hypothetical protein IJC21_06705 [Lentisphaeria bacterium]|nr:hypothetical protein [Lentisphaeria bacterium]